MPFPLLLALLGKFGAVGATGAVAAPAAVPAAATAASAAAPAAATSAGATGAVATGGIGKGIMSLLSSNASGAGLSKTASALSSIGKNGLAETIKSGAIKEALPELGKKILTNALSEDPDGKYVAPFLNGGVTFGKGVGEGVRSYLDSSGIMSRDNSDSFTSGVDAILNRVKMKRAME